jgi:hypothetical protein
MDGDAEAKPVRLRNKSQAQQPMLLQFNNTTSKPPVINSENKTSPVSRYLISIDKFLIAQNPGTWQKSLK